jgi:ABC-type multidrug transport system fused ATPase/permease subunit
MDDGQVVQTGTHAELLQTSPVYQQMVNAYGGEA